MDARARLDREHVLLPNAKASRCLHAPYPVRRDHQIVRLLEERIGKIVENGQEILEQAAVGLEVRGDGIVPPILRRQRCRVELFQKLPIRTHGDDAWEGREPVGRERDEVQDEGDYAIYPGLPDAI